MKKIILFISLVVVFLSTASAQLFNDHKIPSNELVLGTDEVSVKKIWALGKTLGLGFNETDGKIEKTIDGGSNWTELGEGGGGQGGINYLLKDDTNFEDGVGNWERDTNLGVYEEVVNPIRGLKSLKIVKDSNVSGQSVKVPFTIEKADLNKDILITFDQDFSDADYSDGHAEIRVVKDPEGTPVVLSITNGKDILNGKKPHVAEFKTDSTELDYELQIYWVDNTAADIVVSIDNVIIGPERIDPKAYLVELSNTTNWQSFPSVEAGVLLTGATTNPTFGSTSNNQARWRQVGENMEIEWDFTQTSAGTNGSGLYLFNLPEGYKIDTSKKPVNTSDDFKSSLMTSVVGAIDLHYADSTAPSTARGFATPYSDSQIKFSSPFINISGSSDLRIWAGDGTYSGYPLSLFPMSASVRISVPIVGWTATTDAVVKKPIITPDRAGFIALSAGDFAETNDLLKADGRCVLKSDYPDYLANVGTTHGECTITASNDGMNLPDLITDNRFIRTAGGGLAVGTVQSDATAKNGLTATQAAHSHRPTSEPNNQGFALATGGPIVGVAYSGTSVDNAPNTGSATPAITIGAGDSETRPHSIAFVAYVRMKNLSTVIVATLDSTKVECQTKYVPSSVSSNGTIASLSSTLEIGKKYSSYIQGRVATGGDSFDLYANQGTSFINFPSSDNGGTRNSSSCFEASSTTFTVSTSGMTTAVLLGDGFGSSSYVTLCQLPDNYICN